MALASALAARRELAQKRIIHALEGHADEEKLAELKESQIPTRDPEYQAVTQLELIAAIAEALPNEAVNKASDGLAGASLDEDTYELLIAAGYLTVEEVRIASDEELLAIKGIGPARLAETREAVG